MAAVHPVKDCEKASSEVKLYKPATYRWFPSFRMLTASMLCLCFARCVVFRQMSLSDRMRGIGV